jgi:hypothetical protein
MLRYATTGVVEDDDETVGFMQQPPVVDMGAHPPLFLSAPLPGDSRFPGSDKAEAKWQFIHSASVTITSSTCLLPVSAQGGRMPVSLHPDEPLLFHVDADVASQHGPIGAAFDFLDPNLWCFKEVTFSARFDHIRSLCKQKAGVTPPNTCYAMIPVPSQLFLASDSRGISAHALRPRLHSRVLYKAVTMLSLAVAHGHGEADVVDLVSPVFFTAFRQKMNFAYLLQAEGAFDTAHLETPQSLVLVAQWRRNTSQPNSFYFPNRSALDFELSTPKTSTKNFSRAPHF